MAEMVRARPMSPERNLVRHYAPDYRSLLN